MAKDCYLEIDGKRTKLTDEQLKTLGLYEEPKENLFERVEKEKSYYYITNGGDVDCGIDYHWESDNKRHNVANYCTDKSIMEQRALHETLNRILWRFSMENNGDKIDWKRSYSKWHIYFDEDCGRYKIDYNMCLHYEGAIYFNTKEIAQRAIDEIILPFMKDNPGFIW